MTSSTLILDQGTNGTAQVRPSKYPSQVLLSFEPQGDAQVYYGVNGQQPTIPLHPGQTPVLIEFNTLQLQYRISQGQTKLQWDVE
ncbi:hypothetical protein [Kordia sp.]|uniref:hypothetical protein n=1 Tax=Kordia sp. TaxID=1965332 RepID=UPI003D6B8EEE